MLVHQPQKTIAREVVPGRRSLRRPPLWGRRLGCKSLPASTSHRLPVCVLSVSPELHWAISSSGLGPGCATGGPRGTGGEILSLSLIPVTVVLAVCSVYFLAVQLTLTARLDVVGALCMDSWNMSFEAPHIFRTSLSLCSSQCDGHGGTG